jgi:hypothetical protein
MQFDQLKRCEFIMLLGSVVAWPIAAGAQQPLKIARIGYLSAASVPDVNVESFKEGMRSLGYVEVATSSSRLDMPRGTIAGSRRSLRNCCVPRPI